VASAHKVTADYDHSVDFSKYKTFMWIDTRIDEPFMKERIMSAVNSQLTARGMSQVENEGCLAVGANLATEEKHTWETYYSGDGWGWGSGWATTVEKVYQVGTLTVDLFDAQSKKLVWQGISIDTLSRKPDHRTREYDKGIEKMFREFPPYAYAESTLRTVPVGNLRSFIS